MGLVSQSCLAIKKAWRHPYKSDLLDLAVGFVDGIFRWYRIDDI